MLQRGLLVVQILFLWFANVTFAEYKCFCHLTGQVDDCFCDIETLEKFNEKEIFPLLQLLVKQDFFRYYKVNLFKTCKFFDGDRGFCENEACSVKPCSEDELPVGMRSNNNKGHDNLQPESCRKVSNSLGDVNETISNVTMNFLDGWDKHDDSLIQFCEIDDESSSDMHYADLTSNPERYTGYKGQMAWRIWRAIYEENCFMPEDRSTQPRPFPGTTPGGGPLSSQFSINDLQGLCLEKRVFFRVISGLHTSINLHLCSQYLFEDGWGEQRWGPNLAEFVRRFDPAITNGQGTARLKNLYFIYLLELRALSKVSSYFNKPTVQLFTGHPGEDAKTKGMLLKLLEATKKFPMHFDEDLMFKDGNAQSLKREFTQRFLNVTRIIDCVTCEKCRLWGKLQTQGLGTALKILFSGKEIASTSEPSFHLLRQEVVSLVNAFARLSQSIASLETFRDLIERNEYTKDEL